MDEKKLKPTGKAVTAMLILSSAEMRGIPKFSSSMMFSAILAMDEKDTAVLREYFEHGSLLYMGEKPSAEMQEVA